jgi:hypothetical protein
MRKRKFIIALMVFFAAACRPLSADDIALTAVVETNRVTLGNSTHLVLTVEGSQNAEPIDLPVIEGFDSKYLGPQTAVSIVNGKSSVSKSFIYVLFSNKAGKFTIPALSMTVDGKQYQSQPIEISVDDVPAEGGEPKTSGSPTAVSLQDKIMLMAAAPKKEMYLHEQVPLSIKLFYGGVNISDVQYPTLEATGFTKTEFGEPEQNQQILNGMGFNVVNFTTLISPTRAGELVIGPAQLQANILYKSQNQPPINSAFGTDIFDNFFTSYERRQFTVNSEAIRINVLPLPEEGKPENFSGAVGKYDFTATATPTDVKVGDPITLRMKVIGNGDLKTVTMPSFTGTNFKTYDPQIKDEGIAKILEQVIIPTSEEIKEVPAVSFSYFDTETKEYKTITQGSFPITVAAPNPGEEFKAVGFEAAAPLVRNTEEVGKDIVFIKERLDDLRLQGQHFYNTWIFWLISLIYVCVWTVCLSLYFVRRRLKTDTRFARKLKAPRQARQGLESAKALMRQKDAKAFYSAAVRTLSEYIGNQLHISSGGLTGDAVVRILNQKGFDAGMIESVKNIFESADMVRFASARPDEQQMKKDFERLKAVIEGLEKKL